MLGYIAILAQPYQLPTKAINEEKLRADLSKREKILLKYLIFEKTFNDMSFFI